MRNDRGRILMIVALVACMGVLFLVCADPKTVTEMYVESHRENATTFIEKREDGTIFIGGSGKVVVDDVEQLMREKGIGYKDFVNVVFGDEITEIGFNMLNRSKVIKTLKLGRSVTTVHNGAFCKCTSLHYVYLPKGLKQISKGFLFDCDAPYIVTDAAEGELIELSNVSEGHIIYNVDSAEKYLEQRAATPVRVFSPAQLFTSNPEGVSDPMVLRPGDIQYGPYITLEAGSYVVRITGQKLGALRADLVDIFFDGTELEERDLIVEDDSVTYAVTLDQRTDNLEFRVLNGSTEDMIIDSLSIFENDPELPEGVREWWA